jgi:hypothetical protein
VTVSRLITDGANLSIRNLELIIRRVRNTGVSVSCDEERDNLRPVNYMQAVLLLMIWAVVKENMSVVFLKDCMFVISTRDGFSLN